MPGLNKRSVLNMNVLQLVRDYPFINFLKLGGMTYDSHVISFDANGYATSNTEIAFGATSGFNYSLLQLPSSADAPGSYVLSWTGTGTIWLDDGYTWTVNTGASSGYSILSNGRYSGTNAHIVLTLAGFPGGTMGLYIRATDPSVTGDYLHNLKFYMLADETDLNAGKVFRSGWKNTILDLNPGVIRPLNWNGGSAVMQTRWSDRIKPDAITYVGLYGTPMVPYPASTGTNAMVVASATGMPASMTHGEIAAFKIGASAVLSGTKAITGISKAANGVVTCNSHGYTNGQKVVLMIGQGKDSMYQMHWKVCTVAGAATNTFQTGVNTSGFDTFTTPGDYPGACVMTHLTLNVGARGEYPVIALDGFPIAFDGAVRTVDGYGYCVFDKYIVGDRDVGPGAWLTVNGNVTNDTYITYQPGVPYEICTAMINELNAQKQATTGGGAINLWVTTAPKAMMSVDPDYTSGENYPVKAADICLNGDGGSWPGLTAAAALIMEFSNETWNGPFAGTGYLCRAGQLRYDPGAGVTFPFTTGINDVNLFSTIRSIVMCQDLATAYPTEIASGRLIRMAAGQGVLGISGVSGGNADRVYGYASVLADAWNVGNTNAYTKFEAFAWASYFFADQSYNDANMETLALAFAAGDATAKEAACSTYVDGIKASSEGPPYYITVAGQFNTALGNIGRSAVQYEGGHQLETLFNPAYGTATAAQVNAFMIGVIRSAAWAAEQKRFHTAVGALAHHYHPAIFIQVTNRMWGYNLPYPDTYLSGVEGGSMVPTWYSVGEYDDANDTGTTTAAVPDTRRRRYVSFSM